MPSRNANELRNLLRSAEDRVSAARKRYEEALHSKRIAETRFADFSLKGYDVAIEISAIEAAIKEKAPQAFAQGDAQRDKRLATVINFRQVKG